MVRKVADSQWPYNSDQFNHVLAVLDEEDSDMSVMNEDELDVA